MGSNLVTWTRFDVRECVPGVQHSIARVQCLADVMGPYPDALAGSP
jgi:hypothetical protein